MAWTCIKHGGGDDEPDTADGDADEADAADEEAVVVNDAIAIRSMMNLCLTFDHRILDGIEAGTFLAGVRRRLEVMGPEMVV